MRTSSVLVVVKGEQHDEEIVRLGCELLNSHKGRLHILYVIEVERGLPVDAEVGPAIAKAEEVLQHMEVVAKPYKCKADAGLVQARQSGSAVVQEAFDKNVDTIVLAVPQKQTLGPFSLGETIPFVLNSAPCSVILWKDPAWDVPTDGGAS